MKFVKNNQSVKIVYKTGISGDYWATKFEGRFQNVKLVYKTGNSGDYWASSSPRNQPWGDSLRFRGDSCKESVRFCKLLYNVVNENKLLHPVYRGGSTGNFYKK